MNSNFEFLHASTASLQPRIGVSSCLLGDPVRYDGGHKYTPHISALASQCQFISYCPEAAAGMGTPRPPIQLIASNNSVRARGIESPCKDVTNLLVNSSKRQCEQLQQSQIHGYIFKARSPSCGLRNTPVVDCANGSDVLASGLFATQLQKMLPWVTMLTETELCSTASCQYFLRICQLGIELNKQSDNELRCWHQHYRARLGLPAELENLLALLLDKPGQRRAYWQRLQSWMLEHLP
jgi:uncharacterized protein YbbK (DUF523 family)